MHSASRRPNGSQAAAQDTRPFSEEAGLGSAENGLRSGNSREHRRPRSDLFCDRACSIQGGGHRIDIKMSMTAPGCGMGNVLKADVESKLATSARSEGSSRRNCFRSALGPRPHVRGRPPSARLRPLENFQIVNLLSVRLRPRMALSNARASRSSCADAAPHELQSRENGDHGDDEFQFSRGHAAREDAADHARREFRQQAAASARGRRSRRTSTGTRCRSRPAPARKADPCRPLRAASSRNNSAAAPCRARPRPPTKIPIRRRSEARATGSQLEFLCAKS